MTPRQLELALKRQRLAWLAESQRQDLGRHLQVFLPAFSAVDQVVGGAVYLRRHPQWLLGAAALFVVLRPRRAWRWSKRGFFAWSLWRKLNNKLKSV